MHNRDFWFCAVDGIKENKNLRKPRNSLDLKFWEAHQMDALVCERNIPTINVFIWELLQIESLVAIESLCFPHPIYASKK